MHGSGTVVALWAILLTTPLAAQSPTSKRALERTVRYEYRIFNPSDEPSGEVTCWVPLPWGGDRQNVRYLMHSDAGFVRRFTDDYGQDLLEYRFASVPERGFVEAGFTVGIELRDRSWPDPDGARRRRSVALSEQERARCLAAESNYSMDAELMQRTARELTAEVGSDFEKLARIYQHVTGKVRYVRDGRWDPAVEVLERGTGSCSEYNYLLSGLCRLAGLPTRCVGGSSSRNEASPYTDTVFHRWTEVWLDGYGWYPLDCSRGANPRRGAERHFGRVEADLLVWCRQPSGGDDYLGWEYRAQLRRDGGGPRLRTNHRARWFGFVPEKELAAAVDWVEGTATRLPDGDALEAALVAWDRATAERRVEAVRKLADAERPEALRRTLMLGPEQRSEVLATICAEDLRGQAMERVDRPWRMRGWFRDHESTFRFVDGMLTLDSDR